MTENQTSVVDRLEDLRRPAMSCERCKLAETRRNVVFGEGNPETPLVMIGEGPGDKEDQTGRPFVGRAGILLDQALAANRMSRKHVYIANVVKCRACIIENGRARNRPPELPEITACLPWLEEQLAIIKPLVILCLGAVSANQIIHKGFRMTKERGQWFESRYAPHAIAALHPAYILRQAGEAFEQAKASLIADIDSARRRVIQAKKEPPTTLL